MAAHASDRDYSLNRCRRGGKRSTLVFVGGSCVVVRQITRTIPTVRNLRGGSFRSRPNLYSGKAVKEAVDHNVPILKRWGGTRPLVRSSWRGQMWRQGECCWLGTTIPSPSLRMTTEVYGRPPRWMPPSTPSTFPSPGRRRRCGIALPRRSIREPLEAGEEEVVLGFLMSRTTWNLKARVPRSWDAVSVMCIFVSHVLRFITQRSASVLWSPRFLACRTSDINSSNVWTTY